MQFIVLVQRDDFLVEDNHFSDDGLIAHILPQATSYK
jgi:hypothetical protein